jgi:PIN domain nuclease of toxin-antitoxin system
MPEVILDASALLALLNAEPGSDVVEEALPGAVISAVNLSEVVAKICSVGMTEKMIHQVLEPLGLEIVSFDEEQAYKAGLLRSATKDKGISLGDRACLSLGSISGLEILTADTTWKALSVRAAVRVIR